MSFRFVLHKRNPASGVAMVEMALVLPILIALALPVIDYARNILVQSVLTGMAREGANLVSRSGGKYSIQTVMDTIAEAAPPLNMNANGMIYITQIHGSDSCGSGDQNCSAEVVAQYRWNGGGFSGVESASWSGCTAGSWTTGGQCDMGGATPSVGVMNGQLFKGQTAFVVETFYRNQPIVGALNLGFIKIPAPSPIVRAVAIF